MPQLIAVLAIIGVVLYLYYLFVTWFFTSIAPIALTFGCLGLSVTVVVLYLRAMGESLLWGTGPQVPPSGAQPAFRQYFFEKAFRDYQAVFRRNLELNRSVALAIGRAGGALFTKTSVLAVFTWPMGVVFFGVLFLSAIPAVLTMISFGVFHLIVVLCTAGIMLLLAGSFRLLETLLLLYRRVFLACPSCYKRFGLATHACPGCGAEHSALVPGTYGIFRRRCGCGQLLPTLYLFGRARLPSSCPHCSRPLHLVLDARNLHVPVVGGPSAGKTSYLMATMVQLDRCTADGSLAMSFPDALNQRLFAAARESFQQGEVLLKSADLSPHAFRVRLDVSAGKRSLLYVYDAAGELYQGRETLRAHEYYAYTHGVLFLVDPFSLDAVRGPNEQEFSRVESRVKASVEHPQFVYDRMIATLREHGRLNGRIGGIRLAVVLTKSDALMAVGRETALPPARPAEGPTENRVRRWLRERGEDNLVRCFEHDFREVEYFHCSALGRLPDESSRPFQPDGVLAPLSWLLEPYGIRLDLPAAAEKEAA